MDMTRDEWDAYSQAMAVDDQEAVRFILQEAEARGRTGKAKEQVQAGNNQDDQ